MPRVYAIIAAAGSGTRMGSKTNKPFLMLNDSETVIGRTCRVFASVPDIEGIIVMAKAEEVTAMRETLAAEKIDNVMTVVPGGESRAESVYLGLKTLRELAPKDPAARIIALVHDGARCLVTPALIERTIKTVIDQRCGAGVAVPETDTIRVIDDSGHVIKTPERANLMAMQTPQGADLEILISAYEEVQRLEKSVTDDLAALEQIGYPVRLVEGERDNIKITHAPDLELARIFLQLRERS